MTLKIKHKLAIVLLIASIISMSIIAALGYFIAKKTSTQQTFEKLTSIRNSKSQEISDYFHRLQDLASLISSSKITQDAFTELSSSPSLRFSPSSSSSSSFFRTSQNHASSCSPMLYIIMLES